jgi:ParB family chromosome partitioning protein
VSERFRSQVDELLADQPPDDDAALGSWLSPSAESRVEEIAIELVREAVWRPADDSSDPAYRALKASVRASGILQPLLLRPRPDGTFEVVSGARRLRAARETAQSAVPAIVRELSDVEALVGGWDSMLRGGLSGVEREQLRQRLGSAGMSATEAEALIATVPSRDTAAAHGAVREAPPPPAPPVSSPPRPIEVATPPVEEETDFAGAPMTAFAVAPPPVVSAVPDLVNEADFAGAPMSESPAVGLAPSRRPADLPVDPVVFPVGPLEPVWVVDEEEEEEQEPTQSATGPPPPAAEQAPPPVTAVAAVEVLAPQPVRAPEPARGLVEQPAAAAAAAEALVVIDLPAPAAPEVSEAAFDAPPVAAPSDHVRPSMPAVIAEPQPAIGPRRARREPAAAKPAPARPAPPAVAARAPQEPVPAIARTRPSRARSPFRAIIDPRTVATVGVAAAVGAIVFLVVAVILGAGAGRPLTIAIVVALVGFFLAIISLALPRRDL